VRNLRKKKTRRERKKNTGRATTRSGRAASSLIQRKKRGKGRILKLRSTLGLPRKDFARLLLSSERTLASIESGRKPSPKTARDLHELQRIIDALSEVIDADSIGDWLREPNDAFGGLKPMEVIERGEADRIWEMIFYLRSGIPA